MASVPRSIWVLVGFYALTGTDQLRAHVVLDEPNGGETLVVGTTFTVEWHIAISHTLLNWDLWYSTTGSGGPWISIAQNLPAGSGAVGSVHTYDWTIPDAPGTNIFVRVRMDNAATDYYDVSNSPLSIVPFSAPEPPLAENSLQTNCSIDDECENAAVCVGGRCYVPKNRYISVGWNPEDKNVTARRVVYDSGVAGSITLGWIGQPAPNGIAPLSAAPYYTNWSGLSAHVGHCAISPGNSYIIQAITEGYDTSNETAYSTDLVLPTVDDWGDVEGNGGPPQGAVNFADILEIVLGFQAASDLPIERLDLGGETPSQGINFEDILLGVGGFTGAEYPYSLPEDCP